MCIRDSFSADKIAILIAENSAHQKKGEQHFMKIHFVWMARSRDSAHTRRSSLTSARIAVTLLYRMRNSPRVTLPICLAPTLYCAVSSNNRARNSAGADTMARAPRSPNSANSAGSDVYKRQQKDIAERRGSSLLLKCERIFFCRRAAGIHVVMPNPPQRADLRRAGCPFQPRPA